MAQKIVTIYTDDMTGEESQDVSTHNLVLDGIAYEVDLAPDSYDKLLEAMAPFLNAGRRSGRERGKPSKRATEKTNASEIRAWAKEKGFEVNGRGRVPKEVREAYAAAH
ncbi:histone-like nucleoid-structuring protein Lsr2 [Streptomyces vinaceus]|uniref:histone-like nucleoid-structuring protein Lsr2 n=1 Tax=Streptomyces vinaceus TaxID=1960 RepID=UPI00380027E1